MSVFAIVSLLVFAVRAFLIDSHPALADLVNAAIFALLLAWSFARPRHIRLLGWLGLGSLFLNVMDGMQFAGVVPHVLILVPLLVLYGALLGDVWISLAALGGVAAICAYTWARLEPLARRELFILSDVCLLALFAGLASLSVWWRHRRLEKELFLQAEALREELDLRSRLQAIISHDIRNPLMVLLNAAVIDDPHTVQTMAQRISSIVDATNDLSSGQSPQLAEVTLAEIGTRLNEVFAARLADKGQTLAVAPAPDLVFVTDVPMLCNSVLGNMLGNAIKFSPRGATIRLAAAREDNRIRIVIADQGAGFPVEVLKGGLRRKGHRSQPGTEGERGTGSGLPIAALCAVRLGGSIEIRNRSRGGAAASVLLPDRAPLGSSKQAPALAAPA